MTRMRADDEGQAGVGGLELHWESYGRRSAPPVLLIAGLGGQLLNWEPAFCRLLAVGADGTGGDDGYFVVCYDNRDVGLSTHLEHLGTANPMAAAATGTAPYTLADMATDAVGLLDALGLDRAHVVGVSMGGMIAQELALAHPGRVRSLVSIMSSTGSREVGQPTDEARAILLRAPAADRDAVVAGGLEGARVIGSTGFTFDEELVTRRITDSYDRAFDPEGSGRQLAAILAAPDRTQRLRQLDVPTLVLHGDADPLVDRSGGEATAQAVPGARLEIIEGMGHELPSGAWDRLTGAILDHIGAVESA